MASGGDLDAMPAAWPRRDPSGPNGPRARIVTVLGVGSPPQPFADFRVDLLRCRAWPFTRKSLQHPLPHLVEVQGDPHSLSSGIRQRHPLTLCRVPRDADH